MFQKVLNGIIQSKEFTPLSLHDISPMNRGEQFLLRLFLCSIVQHSIKHTINPKRSFKKVTISCGARCAGLLSFKLLNCRDLFTPFEHHAYHKHKAERDKCRENIEEFLVLGHGTEDDAEKLSEISHTNTGIIH